MRGQQKEREATGKGAAVRTDNRTHSPNGYPKSRWGEILRTLQPKSAVQPANCKTGPGVFPGSIVARGVALTCHLHLAQRLSKEWSSTSTSPLRPHGHFYGES